jgi:hypothetical protein
MHLLSNRAHDRILIAEASSECPGNAKKVLGIVIAETRECMLKHVGGSDEEGQCIGMHV